MANIRIKRTHRFGLNDARARVEVFAQSLREELQIDYAWDGNRLTFKRTSASGAIEIGADSIDLEVELGIASGCWQAPSRRTSMRGWTTR